MQVIPLHDPPSLYEGHLGLSPMPLSAWFWWLKVETTPQWTEKRQLVRRRRQRLEVCFYKFVCVLFFNSWLLSFINMMWDDVTKTMLLRLDLSSRILHYTIYWIQQNFFQCYKRKCSLNMVQFQCPLVHRIKWTWCILT